MRWALALLLLMGCSRTEPSPTGAPSPTPAPAPSPDPTPVAGRTPSPSCPEVALAPRSVEQRVSFTPRAVNGKNLTGSYAMNLVAAGPGARWAGAAYDGAALWDGTERMRHISCSTGACTPHELSFTGDGKTLLVGISRLDTQGGEGTTLAVRAALDSTDMNEIEAVAWAPDGKLMLAAVQHRPSRCCREGESARPTPPDRLLAIDGVTGALLKDLGARGTGTAMAVGATQLVAVGRDGLTAWDRATLTPTVRDVKYPSRIALHPSGALLATTVNGEITLWRMPEFCPFARFTVDREHVDALALHPTAPVIFVAGRDATIRAFSTERPGVELGSHQERLAQADIDQLTSSMVVTSDGRFLMVPVYMDERVLALEIGLPP